MKSLTTRNLSLAKKELRRGIVRELYAPYRRTFPRMSFRQRGLLDTFQIDLIDFQKFKNENRGHRFALVVIDIFSKLGWALPLKTKRPSEVALVFEKSVLKKGFVPKHLHADEGREFLGKPFVQLTKKYGLNLYNTFSTTKAAIVERFNRTLKNKIYRMFAINNNHQWVTLLPKIVSEYNHTIHSTTKMKPIDVGREHEGLLLNSVYRLRGVIKQPRFRIGDQVRISKYRDLFKRGFTQSWSSELFRVYKILPGLPNTYLLQDLQDEPILGRFYPEQMLKTKFPNKFLVEKIIKICPVEKRAYVKFVGLPANSWIPLKDVI